MSRQVPNHKTLRHAPDEAFASGRPVSSGLLTNINRELAFLYEALTGGPVPGNAEPTLDGSEPHLSPHDHTGYHDGVWTGTPILRQNLSHVFAMGTASLPNDPTGHPWDFPGAVPPRIVGVNADMDWLTSFQIANLSDEFFNAIVMPIFNDLAYYLYMFKHFRIRKGTQKVRIKVWMAHQTHGGSIDMRLLLKVGNYTMVVADEHLTGGESAVGPYWYDAGEVYVVPGGTRLPEDSDAYFYLGAKTSDTGSATYVSLWMGGVVIYETA